MTSRIISGGKSGDIPASFERKDIAVIKQRKALTFKKSNGIEERRDLTKLSSPYDLAVLRKIPEISDILNQAIDAYVTNITGFGFGIRYKLDDANETPEMKQEWDKMQELINGLSYERPAKEVIGEVIRHVEECGNGYIEIIRDLKGDVVGIDSVKPETLVVTKLNTVINKEGQEIKVRYFNTTDSKKWFKSYGDLTPLNVDGSIASADKGSATELIHVKIGDYQDPYGVPRWIGALLKVLGSRKADELNFRYFTQGRHIPLAIILENAQLTEQSEATLQNYANAIGGEENQHKFLLLEAEKVAPSQEMMGFNEDKNKPSISIEKLSDILQNDALFLEYNKNVAEAVMGAFRLPPIYVAKSDDYTRATAETAKELTEEQVFQPLRDSYDWRINSLFREYDFKYVEVYLKSSNIVNMEDVKSILDPAISAGAVAPNDLRDIISQVLNKPLESFEGDEYNQPLTMSSSRSSINTSNVDVSKAYGDGEISEVAASIRQWVRSVKQSEG